MEQPGGDPHSIKDDEFELQLAQIQIPSPSSSCNPSLEFQNQDVYSHREENPLYPHSSPQKDTKAKVKKPEKLEHKFCFGMLDKKDGCCINTSKIIFIICFFPFICLYLSVKGIYKKCLVPCCSAFNRCCARSYEKLYKGILGCCNAYDTCLLHVIECCFSFEKCVLNTFRKCGLCFKNAARSVKSCVRPLMNCITGACMKVFKGIKYVYVNFCKLLCMVCKGMFKCISKSAEMLCKYPLMCCEKLCEIMVEIGEGIIKVIQTICGWIVQVIEAAARLVKACIRPLTNCIAEACMKVLKCIEYVYVTFCELLRNGCKGMSKCLSKLYEQVVKIGECIKKAIQSIYGWIGKVLKALFGCIFTAINKSIITPVVNSIRKLLKSFGNCFKETSNSNRNNNNNNNDEEA